MKILTVVYSIGPGGTERAAVNYAAAYKRSGCDSRIWVLGNGLDRKEKLDKEQVICYLDKINDAHEQHKVDIIAWKPDIVHIHSVDKEILHIAASLKAIGAKVVETNVFSRPHYDRSGSIIDVSFQLAYWGLWKYHQWMRCEKAKPINLRLPYLIFEEDFSLPKDQNAKHQLCAELNIPLNSFIAGRVGQAHPSKWDVRILDVAERVVTRNNGIYFVFVGLPEKFKKLLVALPQKIQKNIRLIDFISGDEALTNFYSALDVFVHMSAIGESFGYVLTESLLCGCPVICLSTPFKDNAQFEVVENKIGGYCTTSVKEFVARLLDISKNKDEFEKINLRKHIVLRFSEPILITPLINTYHLLCSDNYDELNKLSLNEICLANAVVQRQIKFYGWRSFFIKIMLHGMHLPLLYKLNSAIKKLAFT